eukprot:TRINITY_DN7433_c0_g1_i5.p1 TRINITY_DN7433_c0_g1~~TRINITY_DN7433_c0_g1_i5.p1  ORF type:complete len:241 (+),score=15.72 TRINITY_DN7433_c0_g1_i5:286-1008(+)
MKVRFHILQSPQRRVLNGALPVSMVGEQVQRRFQEEQRPSNKQIPEYILDDRARQALIRAARAIRQSSWISFWTQATLSVVSSVVFLFSLGFTRTQGSSLSVVMTTYGILAGFVSTVWTLKHTNIAGRMRRYAFATQATENRIGKVQKQKVVRQLNIGSLINMSGIGTCLIGIQGSVGKLVANTLTRSAANSEGLTNPMSIDVFLVQAMVNILMGHFVSLCFQVWMNHAVTTRDVPSTHA